MCGLPACRDRDAIVKMVSNIVIQPFIPRSGVKIDVSDAEAQARQSDNVGECISVQQFVAAVA